MRLYHDKYIKIFILFLSAFSLLVFLCGFALCAAHAYNANDMLVSHDEALASSLLAQGVAKDIIATALTSNEYSASGLDLVNAIGRRHDTVSPSAPFLSAYLRSSALTVLAVALLLSVLLFSGTFLLLSKREHLYQESILVIKGYMEGRFSNHLPQNGDGPLYQIFYLIEQLATILQAKAETDKRQKEFLKNTISDISHQLKTPLFALSMYQEIIENEPDNPDIIKEFSHKAGISLKRMEQLIQSMLKITRLDAGNIIFEKKACNIHELIRHALAELMTRAQAEDKFLVIEPPSMQITSSMQADSPIQTAPSMQADSPTQTTSSMQADSLIQTASSMQADSPTRTASSMQATSPPDDTLLCDRQWTSEAIGNIAKNALDYTNAGDTVRISWECVPLMTRITIADNGDGIAPEDIHHIFKRFYRSKNSLDTQGAGLGLSLAKSIIEGQGGILSVQSRLHEGTVFTLTFLTEP